MKRKTGIKMIIASIIAAGFISVSLISFTPNNNNGLILPDTWKFTTGDNPVFAKRGFNDAQLPIQIIPESIRTIIMTENNSL